MSCPYLEEVVMVFCRAYPVKKLIPRSRSLTASPCLDGGFKQCPFFQEVTVPTESGRPDVAVSPAPTASAGRRGLTTRPATRGPGESLPAACASGSTTWPSGCLSALGRSIFRSREQWCVPDRSPAPSAAATSARRSLLPSAG